MRTPGRWTLRTRLVVATVALTAIALTLANTLAVTLLGNHLTDQVDAQLRLAVTAAAKAPGPPPTSSWRFPRTPDTAIILRAGSEWSPQEDRVVKKIIGERRLLLFTPEGQLAGEFPGRVSTRPVPDPPQETPGFTDNRPMLGAAQDIPRSTPYTVPGTNGPSWRVYALPMSNGGTAVMTASLAEVEATQTWMISIGAGITGVVLLLLGLGAAALVRLGIRPLTRMEETAAQIAAGDFGRRVPEPDPHTEPGRLGVAMNVMLERVETEIAARAKSEARMRRFLADASHELRTPLTSVRGFAELYRRGGAPPGPPLDETMRRIEDEAERMALLVNDLLVLAHLDEERPMDTRPVDLLEIAADTIRDARARLPERQVRLTGFDSLAPIMVRGDEARLRQVAANLVSNALAHTPPDAKVTVRVGSGVAAVAPDAAIGTGANDLRSMGVLEVCDTGPGVPRKHAPHIFERLYRVSESRSRTEGGAGLGLAIVAAIVKAHQGRVELATTPGKGAAFRVLLPLQTPEAASP
ncbi:sensor histidine kinase [Rhizohabitans arisaemae]|uniref:sensor histidine kinase n=1 Tax=Rhizohabitans arisaemae TaxID=2720610 RepID=UPI0024B1B1AB|nr:ATP-binding protein [Rhizohabitans arisaemae]